MRHGSHSADFSPELDLTANRNWLSSSRLILTGSRNMVVSSIRDECPTFLSRTNGQSSSNHSPFGDNGKEAENWSVNLLHPYEGNVSTIGDCCKLARWTGV